MGKRRGGERTAELLIVQQSKVKLVDYTINSTAAVQRYKVTRGKRLGS